MFRLSLLSLSLMAGACGSGGKGSKSTPAPEASGATLYDENTHLVRETGAVSMTCGRVNTLDTLWETHTVDASTTILVPDQMSQTLEGLNLSGSKVQDLSPLFGRKLKFLDLSYSDFQDWGQLAQFPDLQSLVLGGQQMKTAELLAMQMALPQLKRLYLMNTSLDTFEHGFKAFPQLESLSLYMVTIGSDSSPLASSLVQLASLEELHLDLVNPFIGNTPVSLQPFAALTQLGHLTVRGNHIADWESLNLMGHLRSLRAIAQPGQIQPQHIAQLTQLETLDLTGSQWPSYELGRLKSLKNLCLASNNVKDLTFAAELPQLQLLDLRSNFIESLSPLKELGQLQDLVLVRDYDGDVKDGFNPVIQPQKRNAENCPGDAKAKVLREFCRPRS